MDMAALKKYLGTQRDTNRSLKPLRPNGLQTCLLIKKIYILYIDLSSGKKTMETQVNTETNIDHKIFGVPKFW